MDIKNATTTELKVLREKLELELSQRSDEPELPVLRVVSTNGSEEITEDMLKQEYWQQYILDEASEALAENSLIFNIKLQMIPESDHKKINEG